MDYIELLKNINYFSFITSIAKWAFLFVAISILILILGTKFKLFKRNTKLANILVKAYYVIVPLYFLIFAVKFAPVRNSQVEINKAIDKNKKVATEFAYNFLRIIVSDSILTQKSSVKDMVNSYLDIYVYAKDTVAVKKNLNIGKRFIYKLKRKIEFRFLKRLIDSMIIKKTSGWMGVEKSTGKAIYQTDFYDLFREGEIVDIFKMELNKLYGKIYKSMFFLFGIGLLLPIIEITLSKIIKY